jgi:hypothetical protein
MNTTAYVPFINEILSRTNNRDVMSDYYPNKIWVDTETGTFGGCQSLTILDTSDWTDDDVDAFDTMSDSDRGEYAYWITELSKGTTPDWASQVCGPAAWAERQ